jgi:hypothetical protein
LTGFAEKGSDDDSPIDYVVLLLTLTTLWLI